MDTKLAGVAARTRRAGTWRRKNMLQKLIANIHASQAVIGADWAASTSTADIVSPTRAG
jgi:hypothetical protein